MTIRAVLNSNQQPIRTGSKPFDELAKRPEIQLSRGDTRSFEPLIGLYADQCLTKTTAFYPNAVLRLIKMRLRRGNKKSD